MIDLICANNNQIWNKNHLINRLIVPAPVCMYVRTYIITSVIDSIIVITHSRVCQHVWCQVC